MARQIEHSFLGPVEISVETYLLDFLTNRPKAQQVERCSVDASYILLFLHRCRGGAGGDASPIILKRSLQKYGALQHPNGATRSHC